MKRIATMLAVIIAVSAISTDANAQLFGGKKKKKRAAMAAMMAAQKNGPTIAQATKNCSKEDGLFTLYRDTTNGSMYMVINEDQLGKEYIYFSYTENGIVSVGHFRGNFRDNKVFAIRKYYNNIEFVEVNTSYYFDKENAISKSSDANISESILLSESIIGKDKGAYLISADRVFLSEQMHQVKPTPFPSMTMAGLFGFKLGMLNPMKTKYDKVRNYPENTDVIVNYVYDNPYPFGASGGVTDARSVTIKLQHTIIAMPENNYKPRRDDPRMGYFLTFRNDMTTKSSANYKDLIHRWNLEKKDPSAALSEPVKPITWWIENTTPVEFRETIMEAALSWNIAFEKAGFKNAVEVKIQPDTATWNAGDIRYNVLRWTSSPTPPFGGYGPSFVNPRTGEILGADIMLEYIFVTNRVRQERLYSQGKVGSPELMYPELTEEFLRIQYEQDKNLPVNRNLNYCSIGDHLHQTSMFGMSAIKAFNNADDVEISQYIKESLHYLILHEMGHTMGLNHNMKATQLYSPEELHNKALTSKTGLTGSVMDYPAANVSSDPSKQGQYFTSRPGPYDLWAIEYGYSTALEDEAAEEARLEKILSRSTEPELIFGNDADDMRFPGYGIDPRVMIGDMSNDAIAYSEDRIKLAYRLVGNLKKNYTEEGKNYHELRNAYFMSMGEINTAAGVVSRYIGGIYVDRGFAGQKGATKPYTPVSKEDQKRAMKVLREQVFGPNAFKAPNELYAFLQPQRRGYNFFFNNEDPHIHNMVENIQIWPLMHLVSPNLLTRMVDSKLYGNEYDISEYMDDLTDAMFADDMNGSVNTFRQNLQTSYVKILISISGIQGDESAQVSIFRPYGQVAEANALNQLMKLRAKLKAAAAKGDNATKIHRQNLSYQIAKALDK